MSCNQWIFTKPDFGSHGLPMFEFYEQNPTKAARFAQGMGGLSASELVQYFSNLNPMLPPV